MSQPIRVRKLQLEEIRSLGSLFRSEKEIGNKIDFWQDRGQDFLRIYSHHIAGDPMFWGVLDDEKIVGTSGLVPTQIHSPFGGVTTYLDTDLFMAPAFRGPAAILKLIRARNADYVKMEKVDSPLIFGIEHIPDSLQICHDITKTYKGDFLFPFNTQLTEVFLTGTPTAAEAKIVTGKLAHASEELIKQWIDLFNVSRKDYFLAPLISRQTFHGLLSMDSEAEYFLRMDGEKILAAALLVDAHSARRFVLGSRPSLVRARIEKQRSTKMPADSEWRLGMASLSVETKASQLRPVFEAMVASAYGRGLHALAFRDENYQDLQGLSPDQLNYPRRVFVVWGSCFKFRQEALQLLKENKLKIRLDAAFV